MDEKPSLDPIEVARVAAGALMSAKLAAVVGPYSLILLAAIAGAAIRLANRPSTGRSASFFFFLGATFASLVLTVPIASLVASYKDTWEAQWFFMPLAVALAYTADRWKDIANVLVDAMKTFIRNWANKGSKP